MRECHPCVRLDFGADESRPRAQTPGEYDYYNSCFLINPQGVQIATYRKRRLVIFGEYVPLSRWLAWLRYFTPITSGFTPGDSPVRFELTQPHVVLSPLICFEDVFPQLAPDYVQEDSDFLLNLTNNGWFGESAAQWQHAANAVFRAIENGLPLVRCTNNGLSCWIDAVGGMHEVYFPGSRDIYHAGFKIAEIPLRDTGRSRPETFYHRYRDWFGWSNFGLSAAVICARFIREKRVRKSS